MIIYVDNKNIKWLSITKNIKGTVISEASLATESALKMMKNVFY